MKKLFVTLMAACMVFSAAAAASAASFDYGSLVLSIYSEDTTTEYGIDLGSLDDLIAMSNETLTFSYNIDTDSDWYVALFSSTGSNAYTTTVTVGTTSATELSNYWSVISNAANSMTKVMQYYTGLELDGGVVTGSTSDNNSYAKNLKKTYGGVTVLNSIGELDADYVDLYLYNFLYGTDYNTIQVTESDALALIRVYADGTVVINPVPVPSTMILLGSGLLGLIGIRRKHS